LAQGKISEILGPKYQHLDAGNRKDAALHSQRRSVADHPDVEGALFGWQQQIQKRKGTITGHVLKAKAIFGLLCLKKKTWRSQNGHPDGLKDSKKAIISKSM
jgi:hypothetical protein